MGKSIKIAIARMMTVLMVMTLIPFDMLVPARVAKAAEAAEEISGRQDYDFANGVGGNTYFMVAGSKKDKPASVSYGGNNYTGVLKMDSSGKVKFTAPKNSVLELLVYIPSSGYLNIDNAQVKTDSTSVTVVDADKLIYWVEMTLGEGVSAEGYNHIVEQGSKESQLYYIAVTASESVQKPTASITSGEEVIEGKELTLNCATEGASIYYTIDGSEPTSESILYEAPISLDTLGENTIKAIAIKGTGDDAISSDVATFTYTVIKETILAPTAKPASGASVAKDQLIELSTKTEGATIYYTTDETEPTEDSHEYKEPFSIGFGEGEATKTIKAVAIKGENSSEVATFKYTLTGDKLATPTASPAAGTVPKGTKVDLECATSNSGGVKIYYTVDGLEPDATKTEYTTSITITKDTTIKAIALSDTGANAPSEVATFEYKIQKPEIKIASDSTSILSSVSLKGDITFKNDSEEIFDIEIKAAVDNAPADADKKAAEDLKDANGGKIIYYNISLVNKKNTSDTVHIVKGAEQDGVAPAISIKMPYSIASSEANELNDIIVLHGTKEVTSVVNEEDGFTFSIDEDGSYTVIVNPRRSMVEITDYAGYEEGVYAEWEAVKGADGYMAYVAPAGGEWKRIDNALIREYEDYWRVDTVGLAKGNYFIKIDAVTLSADKKKATVIASNTTKVLNVTNYDRTGFAWVNGTSSGAYNEDGTLREGANVIYVTEDTKDTVKLSVVTSSKGAITECTGLMEILLAYKKNYEKKPLNIRLIGNVTPMSGLGASKDFQGDLTFDSAKCGITLEGIGEDAVANGWGIRMKNVSNVEVRNLAVMNCESNEGDNFGLQQDNDHVWIHDCDSFYGKPGSDKDQAKGDGAMDCKKSTYVTFSYNHFWDNGKCCLLGLKGESDSNVITYHHNWFDHSDSRHPRVRFFSAHVYNNYYDGNAKYGVGVTNGSSVFVEANYFLNCSKPMMSSMQGTDALGEGTFSSENGGIIKAYGNYMEGWKSFIPYSSQASVDFDAYVVDDAGTKVPENVKTKKGGTSYNNFDTAATMYDYVADTAEEARDNVVKYAGRLNGGDIRFSFDKPGDAEDYSVNQYLMNIVSNYKTSVASIGGRVEGEPTVQEMSGSGSTNAPEHTQKNVSAPKAAPASGQVEKGEKIILSCATEGASIYYTLDGSTPTKDSIPYTEAIVITQTRTVKAIAVYDGVVSEVSSYRYTVVSEGEAVDPTPGGDDNKFEIKTYMFNPEVDEMEEGKLPADVTQYGDEGYFTIDNTGGKAAISKISSNGKRKAAPAGGHGLQDNYAIRYSFGEATTKDSKQAIRFTTEHAAKVYIGAYASNDDVPLKVRIFLDASENAVGPCVNASTEYSFDVEAGDHVIFSRSDDPYTDKDGNEIYRAANILYVVVEEQVPITTNPPADTVAAPVASQASGEVPKGTKVTLSSTTSGAKIFYTDDGTNPTAESIAYTAAIDLGSVEKTVTLKAVAIKDGKSSTVATYEYQVTDIDPATFVSTPVATPGAGKVTKGTEVTLTCATEGAKIYYTTDKTVPTAESEEYKNSPIVIDETVTIKAIAIKGENSSKVGEFTYTVGDVNPPQDVTVSNPVASPPAGAVAKGTKISLTSATEEAKIYYTTDKSEPTTESELYKEPILITEAMTIKAIAVKENCKDSAVVTFEYTLADLAMEQAKTPKATPGADTVSTRVAKGTEVKLSSVTADAKIYYTTDGTIPTKTSTLYEKAIVIEKDTVIKAIAVKEGFTDSAVATFTYKVLPDNVDYGDITPEDIEELLEKYEASTDTNKTLIPDGLWIAGLSSEGYDYTSSAIRPEVRVYNKNVMLREKADYTISYKNNVKANATVDVNADQTALNRAKAPMVTVTGKGNYSGKEVSAFKILPIDISDDEAFEADEMSFADVKKAKTQVPVLYWNGKSLKKKTDYVVVRYYKQTDITDMVGTLVDSITEDGDYLVELEGKGNFTGNRKVEWHVDSSRKLISNATVKKIPDQEYTLGGATPSPEVSFKGEGDLAQGTDYELYYSNNTQPGVAYVIIKGINNYTGTKRVAFKVVGTPLKSATVTGLEDVVYDGNEQELDIDVLMNGEKLIEGNDYMVTYSSNVKVGKAVVTITGINAYSGVIKKNFRIKAYNVADELIEGTSDITAKYMKGGAKPELHLTYEGMALREGVDYSVTYKNNKVYPAPATKQPQLVIKGKGNFTGTKTVDFTIEAKTLEDVICVVSDVVKNNAGKYISKPVLTDVDGKKLAVNKDYEVVSYKAKDAELSASGAELAVGDVITVELKGKGAYAGQSDAEAAYTVTYKVTEADFSKAKITITPQSYTGKAVTLSKNDITVKVGGVDVAKDDYEILAGSYINNVKKGTAQVTLVGKNGYGGAKTVKFKIGAHKFEWVWRLFSK